MQIRVHLKYMMLAHF